MIEVLLIIGIVVIAILFSINNSKQKNKNEIDNNLLNTKSNEYFELCSKESISFSLENVQKLSNDLISTKPFYKSVYSLSVSKENLIRSLYFLFDTYEFCENESQIFKNDKLKQELNIIYINFTNRCLDVSPNFVPEEHRENMNFGREFNSKINISERQVNELKLIYWRKREHWNYESKKYGLETPMGAFCINQANNSIL